MQEEDASRFQTELEFVQCLCNVRYLHYLAQNKYLEDPAFLNYLDYLQYWNQPQYSRFVVYPQALSFLALLQSEAFRRELSKPELVDMICLLYTSDAADEEDSVDLGGRRIIKKKKITKNMIELYNYNI
eukprot:TRINITY_DN5042_c0_g1_i1.p1 TRINITY_DN5042_c0_g1~~TRINITY_DN5042_c0_g1_i1.p1  ORF type:complete len:129 (+),score=30.44 TRINITY_DN5042_c0_g1_i1:197-583(+)